MSDADWLRLQMLRVVGRLYGRRPAQGALRSLLLIRPDHLGDLLFATPTFRMLREALPQARLTLLVGPWSRPVVERNPDLDEVLTCSFPGFERRPKTGLIAPYRRLFATARALRGRFDAALVLRFDHWWGAWLAAAAGIPVRVGYDRPETRPFLTTALPYQPERHEVEQNAALAAALAPDRLADVRPGPLRFEIGPAARAWAAAWLDSRAATARGPLIAIHAGAGAAVKQWPTAEWATVAGRLMAEFDATILLTGGSAERPLAQEIADRLPRAPLDATGQTDLEQLGALLAQCALALGSDSGPLHLAVAVGTPTVSLYGPVSAAKFGPWGDPARHCVLMTSWQCAPCERLDWPAEVAAIHSCVAAIRVADVLQAARVLLRVAGCAV